MKNVLFYKLYSKSAIVHLDEKGINIMVKCNYLMKVGKRWQQDFDCIKISFALNSKRSQEELEKKSIAIQFNSSSFVESF